MKRAAWCSWREIVRVSGLRLLSMRAAGLGFRAFWFEFRV